MHFSHVNTDKSKVANKYVMLYMLLSVHVVVIWRHVRPYKRYFLVRQWRVDILIFTSQFNF